MTAIDIVTLIDSAERQLKLALKAAADGHEVDLGGLVPWLDRLCATALEENATYAAPGLAILMGRLDTLGAMLRERVTEMNAPADRTTSQIGVRASVGGLQPE